VLAVAAKIRVGIEADRIRRLKYSKSAKGKRERAEQRKRQTELKNQPTWGEVETQRMTINEMRSFLDLLEWKPGQPWVRARRALQQPAAKGVTP
jgi:hypothetical protein